MIKKIYKRYSQCPTPVKASLWFLVCAFLQRGISFITTPVFTRLMNPTEYGQYSVFNSWMGILSVIVTLNLYCGVYTRGLVKFEDQRKEFSSSLQGLTLTLVLCWMIIYLLFNDFWNQIFSLTTIQTVLMFQIMWTSAVFSFWSMEQRVDFKYRSLVVVTLAVSIAKPVLGIILVSHAQDKVTARIAGLAIVELITYSGFFFSQLVGGKKFYSYKYWKHALEFNIPLIPHYLSTSVLNSADRIMIGRMVDQSSAGIYSLAYAVSMIMTVLNTAIMQTLEPWLYKKIKEKRWQDISGIAYPAFILVAFVNLVLIAFAPEAVAIFAPTEYYEAVYLIPPIAMSVFFMFSYTFFAAFEFYYQKTKSIAMATSVGAILNIILNYIFINWFGYYAAAYTTLVCYVVYAASHFVLMREICRRQFGNVQVYSTTMYLGISAGFVAISFLLLISYRYPLLRYAAMMLVVLFICFYRKRLFHVLQKFIGLKKN